MMPSHARVGGQHPAAFGDGDRFPNQEASRVVHSPGRADLATEAAFAMGPPDLSGAGRQTMCPWSDLDDDSQEMFGASVSDSCGAVSCMQSDIFSRQTTASSKQENALNDAW